MRITISTIIIILFTGCLNKKPVHDPDIINIDLTQNFEIKPKSYYLKNNVKYIIPQTSDYLVKVTKVEYLNGKYYLLDSFENNNRIIILDSSGKELGVISAVGKGPGEYFKIEDFTVINDKIFILDWHKHIICYDNQGKFYYEFYITDIFDNINALNDNLILFNSRPHQNSNHFVSVMDQNGNVKRRLLEIDYDYDITSNEAPFRLNQHFQKTINNSLTLITSSKNIIYRISKDLKIDTSYIVSFGKYNLPPDFKVVAKADRILARKKGYVTNIIRVFDFRNFVLLHYTHLNNYLRFTIFDKKSKKIANFLEGEDDIDGFTAKRVGKYENKVLAYVSNERIIKYNPNKIAKEDLLSEEDFALAEKYGSGILAIYEIKFPGD